MRYADIATGVPITVYALQAQMYYEGLMNCVSGVWDERTEKAVKAYQLQNGLPQTGIVDQATYARLLPSLQVIRAAQLPPTDCSQVPATTTVTATLSPRAEGISARSVFFMVGAGIITAFVLARSFR